MAKIHGKNGSVHRRTGATTFAKLAQITSWTVNETVQTIETPAFEEDWITQVEGMRQWTADIEGYADEQAGDEYLNQNIARGATSTLAKPSATMYMRLQRSLSTMNVFEGEVILTNITTNVPVDGVVTFSATAVGNGALYFQPVT